MQNKASVPPDVLRRAQQLSHQCELEQRPNRMLSWEKLPEYLRQHWLEKAQRPEYMRPSKSQ